jgi:hypothetical protein
MNSEYTERVKRRLGRALIIFSVVFYWFGGFLLMREMANGGGPYTFEFMKMVSQQGGFPVVGGLRIEEVKLAKKMQKVIVGVSVVAMLICVAVCVWALAEIFHA